MLFGWKNYNKNKNKQEKKIFAKCIVESIEMVML
jgi:hypothetical protein